MCVCVCSKAVCPSAVRLLCSHRVLSSAGMSAAALEDLRRQQRAVDERLAAVAGAAKRLRRAERAAAASAARAWNLAGRVRNVVLLIYMLSTNDLEPAVLYLRQRGRQNHWPDREDEELAALATEAFLAASVEEIAALWDAEAPADAGALEAAGRYVQQWRVAAWVAVQNRTKGVAPPSDLVLAKFAEVRSSLPAGAQGSAWGVAAMPAARARLTRWRRRLGGRVGKKRAAENIPVEIMREKARAQRQCSQACRPCMCMTSGWMVDLAQFIKPTGPRLGSVFGVIFWCPFSTCHLGFYSKLIVEPGGRAVFWTDFVRRFLDHLLGPYGRRNHGVWVQFSWVNASSRLG